MYCPTCGNEITVELKYCNRCGANLTLPATSAPMYLAPVKLTVSPGESEAEARDPLWFNTSKFPVAHFASTSFKSLGGDRYEVSGKLALKGITRDCVVPIAVKADAAGNRVAEGAFLLKRLEYKIGEGEWADTATVADDIRVRVRIVLPPG